jgi:O-succinylhomoserine sulfhydrylase
MASGKKDDSAWASQTKLVRGATNRSQFRETSEAIFMNSGYVYPSADAAESAFVNDDRDYFVYSRFANPTMSMFEERMAALEGVSQCRAVASGMSAVWNALLACTKAGDRVVGSRALFGSCEFILTTLLPRYGVETELVDGTDLAAWEQALSKPTTAVFIETPSNPTLEVIDLQAVADLAHKAGAKFIVDNVFATPVLQKPFEYGADVVIYSTTKHIDGQGRTLGGAILSDDETWISEELTPFLRHTGPCMSPFNAWTLLKGLETLNLRVDRQCDNALAVAEHLEAAKGVTAVAYPSLKSHPQHELAMKQMNGRGSTMVAFDLGTEEAAFSFLNALTLMDISNNLGDAKSLITHPATTTHQRLTDEAKALMGITPGLIRLSVGLEDVRDLIADIDRGLATL